MVGQLGQASGEFCSNYRSNIVKNIYEQYIRPSTALEGVDWARLRTYAARIQCFGYTSIDDVFPLPSKQCLRALALAKSETAISLFPRLETLDWGHIAPPNSEAFESMLSFIGNATTQITFCFHEGFSPQVISALQSVLCKFPQIQHVKVNARRSGLRDGNATDTEAVSQILCNCSTLRSVKIETGFILQQLMDHLAGLGGLQVLSVRFGGLIVSPRVLPTFQALEKLDITCLSFRTLASLLDGLFAAAPIRDATFTLHHSSSIVLTEVKDLFESIQRHSSHSWLSSLRVWVSRNLRDFEKRLAIAEDVLRPLLKLRSLTILELHLQHACFRMDDDMAKDMAAAWPLLRRLCIGCGGWTKKPTITPEGLIALLNGMPHLNSLDIAINATSINISENHVISANTALTQVGFQNSRLRDADAMAQLLLRAAPNLEIVDAWNMYDCYYRGISGLSAERSKNRWDDVHARIRGWTDEDRANSSEYESD